MQMEQIDYPEDIPALSAAEVAVWGLALSPCTWEVEKLLGWLSEEERSKIERKKRPEARRAAICARAGLRLLLGHYTQTAPQKVQLRQASTGKPFLADQSLSFNLSHSGDWIVWAVSLQGEIGVDLEEIDPAVHWQRVATRYFSEEEQEVLQASTEPVRLFYDLWAMKEAWVKSSGEGVFAAMKRCRLPLTDQKAPMSAEVGGRFLYRIEAGSRYASALATNFRVEAQPCYDMGGVSWGV
jgi:4'-phosphopantetheinyl transferase